jgi:hypothetical protein
MATRLTTKAGWLRILTATTMALAVIAASPTSAQVLGSKPDDLTPEEKAERDGRKECKVQICAAMHNRKPGPDVSCNVVKSWRKTQLDKIVGKAGVSWPWGKVVCTAPINLKRDMLIKALDGSKHEADIGKQSIKCVVERPDGNAEISAEFSPKVTFEGGKAVKAVLNWGKIDAPTLVKGAMWTATATDNTFNVLQGMVVEDINTFASTNCDEVKDEWQGK